MHRSTHSLSLSFSHRSLFRDPPHFVFVFPSWGRSVLAWVKCIWWFFLFLIFDAINQGLDNVSAKSSRFGLYYFSRSKGGWFILLLQFQKKILRFAFLEFFLKFFLFLNFTYFGWRMDCKFLYFYSFFLQDVNTQISFLSWTNRNSVRCCWALSFPKIKNLHSLVIFKIL